MLGGVREVVESSPGAAVIVQCSSASGAPYPTEVGICAVAAAGARGRRRLGALRLGLDVQLRAVAAAGEAGGGVALRALVEVRVVGGGVGGSGAEGARERGDD